MLKFFRRIRQKLLDKGSLRKYSLYALGEILLVMIGILLALQVNNWNEGRKEKKLELQLLEGLKSDLNGSINDMTQVLRIDSIMINNGELLIEILENEASTYQDSMAQLFGWIEIWDPFEPRMMAYENLRSIGYDVISNNTLRSNIVYLFDNGYARQKTLSATVVSILPNQLDIIIKYLRTGENILHKRPNDFEKIKKNEEYLNYLSWMVAARKAMVDVSRLTLSQMVDVRNQIDQELGYRSELKQ